MECPNCGSSELVVFGDAIICDTCGAELEPGEIEYYEGQGDSESEEEEELISLSAIIQLLDGEIKWSKENSYRVDSYAAEWFVNGLGQAKYLILELSKGVYQSPYEAKAEEDSISGTPGWMGDYGATPFGPVDV